MRATATEAQETGKVAGSRWSGAGRVAVAVLVPLVIVGNSLLILLVPWHADLQYAMPGFPEPPQQVAGERSGLARDGIVSIWPVGPGDRILEEARLTSGTRAFGPDEVSHMADVRVVVTGLLAAWLVAVIALALILRTRRSMGSAGPLRTGAWLTLGVFVSVGLVSALSFNTAFTSFHEILFEDGTWTFPQSSTLIGLYPERFWVTATAALVLLSVLQALAVIGWSRRSRMRR